MLAVTGIRTSIVTELVKLTGERAVRFSCMPSMLDFACDFALDDGPTLGGRPVAGYVLAAGVIRALPIAKQSAGEILEALAVNLVNVLRLSEAILSSDEHAKVALIGSNSALHGSYDELYAACKAGVHAYANTRKVKPTQRLVAIAPPLIRDSGMVRARHDYPGVLETRRSVSAREVAEAILEAWAGSEPNKVRWL